VSIAEVPLNDISQELVTELAATEIEEIKKHTAITLQKLSNEKPT